MGYIMSTCEDYGCENEAVEGHACCPEHGSDLDYDDED